MDSEPDGEAVRIESIRFTASGGEYFGIWAVNLLLTLLTLGLYSPWAKVRRLQYFYRSTELAGASFEYHGRPWAIFRGRLLALLLLLAYQWATTYISIWTPVVFALLALLLPWLLRNALRFRLRNSSYRGLRFAFRGSLAEAYLVFLAYPLLVLFTAYLMAPLAHQRIKRYQHGYSYFGAMPFGFDAGVGRFYKIYLPFMLLFAVLFGLAFVPMAGVTAVAKTGAKPDPHLLSSAMGILFGALLIALLVLAPLMQAALQNLIWNGTTLATHRFISTISGWRLMWIRITNFLLTVLTLGLFAPWAAVRVARYRASCLSLQLRGSIDTIVAGEGRDVGAAGEEAAELFDIDIGL